jgi:diguanylate cyclase (GGDEF)-like protein
MRLDTVRVEDSNEKSARRPRTVVGLFTYLAAHFGWSAEVMAAIEPAFTEVESAHRAALKVKDDQLALANERLDQRTRPEDSLTKFWNQSAFDRRLEYLIAEDKRDRQIGIIYFDLSRFKRYNDLDDSWDLGNKALVEGANIVRSHIRIHDEAFRYGGDEFVVIVQNPQNIDAVLEVSWHLLQAFEAHPWEHAVDERFTDRLPQINVAAIFLLLPTAEERRLLAAEPTLIEARRDELTNALKRLNNAAKAARERGVIEIPAFSIGFFNTELMRIGHGEKLSDALPPAVEIPR